MQNASAFDCAQQVSTPPGATVGGVGIPYDVDWNERHPTLDFRITSDPLILKSAASSSLDGKMPPQAMLLRFFNSQTNETMKNVGYSMNISRVMGDDKESEVLNSTSFFSVTGMQAFAIEPSLSLSSSKGDNVTAASTTVDAAEMQYPPHLIPKPGGWITINSSELLQTNGQYQYRAHIQIESVDNQYCILPKEKIVGFDANWTAVAGDGGGNGTSNNYTIAYATLTPKYIPEFPLSLLMLALSVAAVIGFSLVYRNGRLNAF